MPLVRRKTRRSENMTLGDAIAIAQKEGGGVVLDEGKPHMIVYGDGAMKWCSKNLARHVEGDAYTAQPNKTVNYEAET